MKTLRGRYFDGIRSTGHDATLIVGGGKVKVVGDAVSVEADARLVRRSLRIANIPRWLYLPGGGAFVTDDNRGADRLMRTRRYDRMLQRWEARPAYAATAAVLVATTLWLLIAFGIPAGVEQVATRIPLEAEASLGREALDGMDRFLMQPTTLPRERQAVLREQFHNVMEAAGVRTPYRLEFRSSPALGANAFALPSGIIVVMDDLVRLAKKDQEILAVLAHEAGHVHHRHVMRRLLEGSITGLLFAGVTGDVSTGGAVAAAAPTLLLQMKYSRDNEREADAYAAALLRNAGLSPAHLGAILSRLEAEHAARGTQVPGFLSSHPPTQERRALVAGAAGDDSGAAVLKTTVIRAKRAERVDPLQREVGALLRKGAFEELERLFSARQRRFEENTVETAALRDAFSVFTRLPPAAEARLDEWVAKMPASYAARVGRGGFHLWRGIEARGTDYIQNTPKEQLAKMREHHEKARADLQASTGLTKSPFLSHLWLIVAARYQRGAQEQAKRHYAEALRIAPQSVMLRLEYLNNLEPRWGGSHAQMQALIDAARVELKEPSEQKLVAARLPAYKASERFHAQDYALAVTYYDEALRLSDEPWLRCWRSSALTRLKRHKEALADVKAALARERRDDCMDQALWAVQFVEDWKDIIALMSIVIEARPDATGAYNQRGWAYYSIGKLDLAFQDYLTSARMGDATAQLQLGRLYVAGTGVKQDRETGLSWVRKAAAQGEPMARQMLEEQGAR